MQQAVVSIVLFGLGKDALKVAAGLALAVVLALAFTVASLASLLGVPSPARPATETLSRGPFVPAGSLNPAVARAQAVDLARGQIGVPYVWGGASPRTGFDCSGLVQWIYLQMGVHLPRTAQDQFDVTLRLGRDRLQPGDLVFFGGTVPSLERITHVGIYSGNGQMINAPAVGDAVREMPVFSGFWGAHYAGAGRVGG